MSDIELVVKRCKRLESLLTEHFGADGRGLHEKISSVERELTPALVKRLRFIASVRNKLVHEADADKLQDRRAYLEACDKSELELKKLAGVPTGLSWPRTLQTIAFILLLIGLVIILFAIRS
ncbi:hypothetical protein ETAA8_54460 [Anatilimnocola aggregata]|uniref:DUF4145 domain-containing protein n=1 Tax=Anatilimnocola aggregata TaxID=2528021 RepID=A0A517YJC6_9BACT|nr:DUF4145 domain-containing protein [Anatilimnocola aggregata]QDU30326.1 hypothetical protein ETAA8_54460 [Anatilimnocola aggregata]